MGPWWQTLAYLYLPPDQIQPVSDPCVSVHTGESIRVTHCTIECEREKDVNGGSLLQRLTLQMNTHSGTDPSSTNPLDYVGLNSLAHCFLLLELTPARSTIQVKDPSKHQATQLLFFHSHRQWLWLTRPPVRWRHDGNYMMSVTTRAAHQQESDVAVSHSVCIRPHTPKRSNQATLVKTLLLKYCMCEGALILSYDFLLTEQVFSSPVNQTMVIICLVFRGMSKYYLLHLKYFHKHNVKLVVTWPQGRNIYLLINNKTQSAACCAVCILEK